MCFGSSQQICYRTIEERVGLNGVAHAFNSNFWELISSHVLRTRLTQDEFNKQRGSAIAPASTESLSLHRPRGILHILTSLTIRSSAGPKSLKIKCANFRWAL